MKFIKNTLLGLAVVILALAMPAAAAIDDDVFTTTRTVLIGTPGQLVHNILLTTNGPVDLLGYTGRGQIILNVATNMTVLGTVTATIETSPDSTNWTGLGNFALINSATSVSYTNLYYGGTNLIVTDSFLLPYTATLPSAASAGFSTPYPANSIPFTNAAGAITVSSMATPFIVGLNLTDNPRYIHVIWTAGGGATNGNTYVSSLLQGKRVIAP